MAQRKTTTKSRPSSAKAEANSRKKGKPTAEQASARHQVAAILLFFGALLLLALVLIPGASLWGQLHKLLLGLFGICAFVLPVLMGYIAVIAAMEKPIGSISSKLWQCVLLLVMLGSAIYICTTSPEGINYFKAIGQGYMDGIALHSGGVLGVLLGYPLEYAFTDLGAKIIIFLLIGMFLMLVTGTTILSLFRTAYKPVKKTRESIETAMSVSAERRQRKAAPIDIDLGDGYEEEPAKPGRRKAAPPAPLPETAQELSPEQPPVKSDKLAALEKAARDIQAQEEAPPPKLDDILKAKEKPGEDKPDKAAKTGFAPPTQTSLFPEEEDGYRYPPMSLLDEPKAANDAAGELDVQGLSKLLVGTLKDFGVSTRVIDVTRGPSVTRFELEPSAGVKISRITGLADDIALRLATTGVRIEAPIPNKAAVGIEVPNKSRKVVCLRELLDTTEFSCAKGKLTVALGKDIEGKIILADLAKMPHLLIAGTTGSGKSVCTNSMIQSVLYRASPKEVKIMLIDPKQVEFGIYNGIPHLLVPVVTDPRKAAGALGWAVNEMLGRYKTFAENNVRDLQSYNALARKSDTLKELPLILIVIDELADLMMAAASEVEDSIIRLAQMARAAGMHMVIATQRPSVDVITGLIKANIPSRLALTVASAVDSRTILDAGGAEKLLGYGDMLCMPVGQPKPRRVQGCFVTNREVESVVDFLKNTEKQEYDQQIIDEIERQAAASGKTSGKGGGDDLGDGDEDDMLPQAIEAVVEAGMASTSMLQRRLRLGYARAGRIMDQLEERHIIGPHEGSKPRQVLITRQQWQEMSLSREDGDEES